MNRGEDIYDDGQTMPYEEIECQVDGPDGAKSFVIYHAGYDRMKKIKKDQKLRIKVKRKAWISSRVISVDSGDITHMEIER